MPAYERKTAVTTNIQVSVYSLLNALQKILYHGTSNFRLQLGIYKSTGIMGDLIDRDRIDLEKKRRFPNTVFLTENFRTAAVFSLLTLAHDRMMQHVQFLKVAQPKAWQRLNSGAVVTVLTSKLPRINFDEDKEADITLADWKKKVGQKVFDEADLEGKWWMYRDKGLPPNMMTGTRIPRKVFGPMREILEDELVGQDNRFYTFMRELVKAEIAVEAQKLKDAPPAPPSVAGGIDVNKARADFIRQLEEATVPTTESQAKE